MCNPCYVVCAFCRGRYDVVAVFADKDEAENYAKEERDDFTMAWVEIVNYHE